MRILITSGGTNVPIDPVRSITNFSTGHFGASIAKAALKANTDVIYLVSANGQSPFSHLFDCYTSDDTEEQLLQLKELQKFSEQYKTQYTEYRYKNYEDYAEQLKTLLLTHKPDIVILAAAVSDYVVAEYSANKLRSSENLTLELKSAPKVIQQIKIKLPKTFLVGFKLLVNASESELIDAAMQSIKNNNADLIIANDLTSLQRKKHEIILVERDGSAKKMTEALAEKIIERVMRR